jgi:hypothetical protein
MTTTGGGIMRKLVIVVPVLAIALVTVQVLAGGPETERNGEQAGKALQAGPKGPRYGNPTVPPPEIIPTAIPTSVPTSVPTIEKTAYRVYLPFVASRVASAPESVSANFTVQWK